MDCEEGFRTENHWKHWVLEISVDFVNKKYRKHHRSSSDEIVVIHQSSMSKQTQLSELIEMVQWPNWEETPSNSVESESKVSNTKRHSQCPHNVGIDESPNSSKQRRTTNHSDHQRFLSPLFLFLRVDSDTQIKMIFTLKVEILPYQTRLQFHYF